MRPRAPETTRGHVVEPWPVGVMTLKNRTLTPVVKLFIECARNGAIIGSHEHDARVVAF